MDRSRVALVRCEDYDRDRVGNAVGRGIELLGGISTFARAGERIVLKPNVLLGSGPEKAVTTHPSVFEAVARVLQDHGVLVSYGDSPAFGGCESNVRRSGIKQVADRIGVTMADFDHGREVGHSSALLNRRFVFANGVLDADGLISLPKLKTHGLVRVTGAIKNQFGCIPGILKGQFHAKMADPYDFATMLVDINTFVKPRLYVMDAVTAMEGNGPRNGKPRQMNVLLFSTDPVATDAIACKMIGMNPEFVPTSRPGETSGLGTFHYENIELVGDNLESFVVADFDVVREPPVPAARGRMRTFVASIATPRPAIDQAKCTACGTCVRMCPVGPPALDWSMSNHHGDNGRHHSLSQRSVGQSDDGKRPRHNYRHCIRCFCCQEVCPEGAITIKTPLVSRLVFRN